MLRQDKTPRVGDEALAASANPDPDYLTGLLEGNQDAIALRLLPPRRRERRPLGPAFVRFWGLCELPARSATKGTGILVWSIDQRDASGKACEKKAMSCTWKQRKIIPLKGCRHPSR